MLDKIKIENLKIFAHHGVYPQETENGQNFYIHAELLTYTDKAGHLDDLTLSTDYGKVCLFMDDYLKKHTFQLLEAAAEHLAEAILTTFSLVREICLEIRKPEAPIPLPFESVSVEIRRKWHTAYIAIGSNMGDRETYIADALERMKKDEKIRIIKVSDILHTKPYGGAATEEFLNGAVKIETLFAPEELLTYLHEIEAEAGREREIHWGNRTLDLDILLYDDLIMSTDSLTIPHPDMTNRDFVLVPLAQIDPYIIHPISRMSVRMLLDTRIPNSSII